MKNLFLAVAVMAMACVGCAKEEPSEPKSLPDLVPIEFAPATITRSTPIDDFESGKSIGIYGKETLSDAPGTVTADWMNNLPLTNSGSAWALASTHYFKKGYSYSFVAYYPYNASATVTDSSVEYTVNPDVAQQEDFLYAPAVTRTYAAADEAVPNAVDFKFNHALAQVKFSAKTKEDYSKYLDVTITKVEIQELVSAATLAFADGAWTPTVGSTGNFSQTVNNTLGTDMVALKNGADDTNVLMLLPQNAAGKTVVLTYTTKNKNGDTSLDQTDVTIQLTIPADAGANTWTSNNIYEYQVTLDMGAVLGWGNAAFADPVIKPWGTPKPPIDMGN